MATTMAPSNAPASTSLTAVLNKPIELVRLLLDERVHAKMAGGREIYGKLHAFDQHMNLVLEDVEEIVTSLEYDAATKQVAERTETHRYEMLFVRGDVLVVICADNR
ncbi:hypothetical protein CXG81DRAFT_21236 [Caulochytrium protostelioides]|uniref:Small nuclear ribonucleo protein-like protein n=1 Tax=Caulochytrium protostelioides TaxID=1555241 RepID=A0A4P9X2B8_9FUNG|nr:small nuclear ribonucleo protein-like protein [Caulochytrium protostelioides]RKO98550.1 hypothetical protein CXG81DRAFT_21236 [Caulochytrium protostelioides]|eukprot:RKO98550.1 hypothetical protein CXG81DRAFT_21236 [Caulochytrium protostelioides]